MLREVLQYLNNNCPICGGGVVACYEKQLAQCAHCHPYGQNAIALLMHSGMTFLEAEQHINTYLQKDGHQTDFCAPAAVFRVSAVGESYLSRA